MSDPKAARHKTVTKKTVAKRVVGPDKATANEPSLKKAARESILDKIAAEETDVLKMFVRTYALF